MIIIKNSEFLITLVLLTESGAYSQLPTHPKKFLSVPTHTGIKYGHPELPRGEKSKFECEEKKFSLLVKVVFSSQKHPQTSLFINKLNFFFLEFKF